MLNGMMPQGMISSSAFGWGATDCSFGTVGSAQVATAGKLADGGVETGRGNPPRRKRR
jgi:hypothetical protein